MNYIRTKDGLFKVLNENLGSVYSDYIQIVNDYALVKKEDIIKQSDLIEELCDEFIVIYKSGERINVDWSFVELLTALTNTDKLKNVKVIYGALWLIGEHGEPILKPFAKTNEQIGLGLELHLL